MLRINSICFSAFITSLLLPILSYANTPIVCNMNQFITLLESNASNTKVLKEAMRCADTTNEVVYSSTACIFTVGIWAENPTRDNKKPALKYCKIAVELGDEESAEWLEMLK